MLEQQRPDFEFDEFFYDDEEEPAELPKSPVAEPQRPVEPSYEAEEPQKEGALQESLPAQKAHSKRRGKKEASPETDAGAKPKKKGIRVKGRIRKRLDTESILPLINTRVDDIVMYMYESGMLKDTPPSQPAPSYINATRPLNMKQAPEEGSTYVLIDALTNQMTAVDGNLRVGRDASFADLIPAGNDTVSAEHAELYVKPAALIVKDIGPGGDGSSNGTFINGVRIPPRFRLGVEAKEGDIIEFSDAKYRVDKI